MALVKVRVVLMGLPPDHHDVPEPIQPEIAKGLKGLVPQFAEAGMDYEFFPVTPEGDLATLGQKLESFRPDCIVIGNGVRSNMDLSHFMEQLIDVVRTSAPQAKLGFNTVPTNTIDVVRRWFPNPLKSS